MRRLTLKTETLTALTTDELTDVAGAAATPLCTPTLVTNVASLCHLCNLLSQAICE